MKSKIKENSGISTRHKPYVIGKDLLQHNLSVRIGNATAKKSTSGITLIALIVTIVVLIILAVISMNLLMNGNIIGRAEQSKEIQARAAELERLELIKSVVALDNKGKVTVDDYIKEAIKEGVTTEEEVTDNGDDSKNIITDNGYNVNIAPDPDNENNVIITIDGKGTELPPRITKLTVTKKDDTTATVTIEVKRAEGATYKYYCKAEGEEYEEPFYTGTDLSKDKTELDLENKEYTIKVEATNQYGTKYKEQKIGDINTVAAIPKLTEGMIPVKWNGTGWEKTTENDPEWYSYGTSATTRKWANVVLSEATFTTTGGKEVLDENKAYSQLVWIPRYAYKITSMYHIGGDAAGNIRVKFINNTTNTDSNGDTWGENYPTVSNEGTTTGKMDEYVVHPAFNFGTDKLTGIWVGKYETSSVEGNSNSVAGDNVTTKTIQIKAGVSSWRYAYIDTMYKVCLAMNNNSRYGLSSSDSVVDPHLMKNDEWGAVAYLSKSRYGKYNEEVRINNNSHTTGNGASTDNESSSTMINKYSSPNGQKASTTGNVYGVYDMSGGAYEYIAGYVNNGHENIGKYGASLKAAAESTTNKKYVNRYYSTTSSGANTQEADYAYANPSTATGDYKHYGDAMWETSRTDRTNSWYNDDSHFPCSSAPFFVRGGFYSGISSAGVFTFNGAYGYDEKDSGFRVVMPVL